jgi:hypothetical protein
MAEAKLLYALPQVPMALNSKYLSVTNFFHKPAIPLRQYPQGTQKNVFTNQKII